MDLFTWLDQARDGAPVTAGGGFHHFASRVACSAGKSSTFGMAVLVLVAWAVMGPVFGFSDTWQQVINTSTTIATFLMVFLIQNTQNRDSAATQGKLDESIRATLGAHNVLLELEERSDDELIVLRDHYADLARRARSTCGADCKTPGLAATRSRSAVQSCFLSSSWCLPSSWRLSSFLPWSSCLSARRGAGATTSRWSRTSASTR
jgi:low affinity Fe/Cu permease